MAFRRVAAFAAVLLLLVSMWEGYKLLGRATGAVWPLTAVEMRPRPGNNSMPHVWDVITALFSPHRRGGEPLILVMGVAVGWKDSGITTPEDWAGKTVGNWGFGNEYELTAAIEAFNVQDVELVGQDFTMAALLNRELDSAEAMTYNEYAQVLEAVNPDTGELYQPEDLDVINFNDVGTAMLQDSLWVNATWIADNEDVAQRFLEATFEGWVFCRDNFDACVDIVLENGSTLGASHQAWQLNEINDLIWPSPAGIGMMDKADWDQTVEIATTQIPDLQGVEIGEDAYRTDLAAAALATLEAEGVDVGGEDFQKIEVELNEAGE